jgi:hypothetical protein
MGDITAGPLHGTLERYTVRNGNSPELSGAFKMVCQKEVRMPADPTTPTSVPPVAPTSTAEPDLDPDALEDEELRDEQDQVRSEVLDEPSSPVQNVPEPDQPTPLSDDLR